MNTQELIVYTIGNPYYYEIGLKESSSQNPLLKMGRDQEYLGGIIFKTKEEALEYIKENGLDYIPYGVILKNGWEEDVDDSYEHCNYNCLLKYSEIIKV